MVQVIRDQIPANVLRAIVADKLYDCDSKPGQGHEKYGDRIVQLETNVDDVTGEVLGHLIELLMAEGALGCFYSTCTDEERTQRKCDSRYR